MNISFIILLIAIAVIAINVMDFQLWDTQKMIYKFLGIEKLTLAVPTSTNIDENILSESSINDLVADENETDNVETCQDSINQVIDEAEEQVTEK